MDLICQPSSHHNTNQMILYAMAPFVGVSTMTCLLARKFCYFVSNFQGPKISHNSTTQMLFCAMVLIIGVLIMPGPINLVPEIRYFCTNFLEANFSSDTMAQVVVCALALCAATSFANSHNSRLSINSSDGMRYGYHDRFRPYKVLGKYGCPGSHKYGNMIHGKRKRLQRAEKRRRREAAKASNHNRSTKGSVVQAVWNSFRHVIHATTFATKLLVQKLLLFCWWLICAVIALSAYLMLVGIEAVLLCDMMHDLLLCYVSLFVFGGLEFFQLEITTMIPWHTIVRIICPI